MAERFSGFNVEAIQNSSSTAGGQAAVGQATRNLDSLANRLKSFSDQSFQTAGMQATAEATDQAAKDDINGKEFHKKDVYTMYGKAYNTARSASYAANSEIDLSTASQALTMEFKGDPLGYRNAMKEYTNTLQSEAPTPELAGVISVSGRKIINYSFGKMSVQKDAEIKASQKVEYTQTIDLKIAQMVNAQSSGDMKTYDLIEGSIIQYSKTMLENGVLTEAELLKIQDVIDFTINKGVAEQEVTDLVSEGQLDMAIERVNMFKEEIQEGYTIEEWQAIGSSMNSIVSAGIKNANLQQKQITKGANNRIKEAISIMESGKYPSSPITEDILANASDEERRKYEIQVGVSSILNEFTGSSLLDKESALEAFSELETATIAQVEAFGLLEEDIEAEAKEVEKEAKEERKVADAKGKDIVAILKDGKVPKDKLTQNEIDLLSPSVLADINERIDIKNIIENIEDSPLLEQEAILGARENADTFNTTDIEVVNALKKNIADLRKAYDKDPMMEGAKLGLYDLTPINLNNPDELAIILSEREVFAELNIAEAGANAGNLFTEEEAQGLSEFFESPDSSVDQILQVLGMIEQGIPDSSNSVYRQLSKKGAELFSYAGGLMKAGQPQKARQILIGKIILRENKGAILTKDVQEDFNGTIGNALAYAGVGQRKALMEATLAMSAYMAESNGELGEFNDGKGALSQVLGDIEERNGQNYILPFGKTEDNMEDLIDSLTPASFSQDFQGMTREEAIEVIEEGQIVTAGNGKYRIKYMNGFLYTIDGNPFILELE